MINTPTFLDTLKEHAAQQNLEVHEWRAQNNQKYDALLREEHGQVVLDEVPDPVEVEVDADTDYREWWSQILTRKMRAEYVPVTEEADVPTNRAFLPHGATLIETEGIIPVFVYGTLRYGQGNYYESWLGMLSTLEREHSSALRCTLTAASLMSSLSMTRRRLFRVICSSWIVRTM